MNSTEKILNYLHGVLQSRLTSLSIICAMYIALTSCFGDAAEASVCRDLDRVRNNGGDASSIIKNCLAKIPLKGKLSIPPGNYHIYQSITIDRPVTIETIPEKNDVACKTSHTENCAVIVVGEIRPSSLKGMMPIEIVGADVELRSLVIAGSSNRNRDWEKQICLSEPDRPLAGGIRVRGNNFHMTNVVLKNFSCYTAMEVVAGVSGLIISQNIIGPNGRHDIDLMWADGITVHDSSKSMVEKNTFLDNTDVQLIFGGCRDCIVRSNKFRHSLSFRHASFAELMLHAWPDSTGDFTGSVASSNDIDCGPSRRCGYGIMIGGEPWYPAKTFGGVVAGNRVSNAQLGINVDHLTGEMSILANAVTQSGGIANSDCGRRSWPAINVSPQSRPFLKTDMQGELALETRKCLLNRRQD